MTDGERTATAVVLSLALHWLFLNGWKPDAPTTDGPETDDIVVVDPSGMESHFNKMKRGYYLAL